MINRQLIRVKATQIFYAYAVNGLSAPDKAEEEFEKSLDRAYELYLYLLSFLLDIRKQAETMAENIEASNQRRRIVIESASAERIFAQNKWLQTLSINETLLDYREHHNDQNDAEYALTKKITKLFLEDSDFLLYLKKQDFSPKADQEIIRRLYKKIVATNEDFESILEDRSLYWNDDKTIIDTFVLKTIRRIQPNGDSTQPLLPAWNDDNDCKFAHDLFRAAIVHRQEANELIEMFSNKNWDVSRIPFMDVVIMQLAVAELIGIPNVEVSITINEYINIARWYSTPQSPSYINGMLDSFSKQLRKDGRMHKPVNNKNT